MGKKFGDVFAIKIDVNNGAYAARRERMPSFPNQLIETALRPPRLRISFCRRMATERL
jgi:hypothetical protein